MWEELGISGGTAIIVLFAMYFVIKWAVKNGIREALCIEDKMKKKEMANIKNFFSSNQDH